MNRMYNVINGVCIRNDERNNEINNRMFARNITDKPLEPNIKYRMVLLPEYLIFLLLIINFLYLGLEEDNIFSFAKIYCLV